MCEHKTFLKQQIDAWRKHEEQAQKQWDRLREVRIAQCVDQIAWLIKQFKLPHKCETKKQRKRRDV